MPSTDSCPANVTQADLKANLKLIRASLLMLLFMTAAFSGAIWNAMQNDPIVLKRVEAIPVMLISVVAIIVARMYMRAGQLAKVCARAVHDRE